MPTLFLLGHISIGVLLIFYVHCSLALLGPKNLFCFLATFGIHYGVEFYDQKVTNSYLYRNKILLSRSNKIKKVFDFKLAAVLGNQKDEGSLDPNEFCCSFGVHVKRRIYQKSKYMFQSVF